MSVRPSFRQSEWNNLATTEQIFNKFDIWRKSVERIQALLKSDKHNIISRSFLLRMKNVSDKICRENKNTHFAFDNFFF